MTPQLTLDAGPLCSQGSEERDARLRALFTRMGLPVLDDPRALEADPSFVERIPIQFARRHAILGLASPEGGLRVALADPGDLEGLDVISRFLGRPTYPVLSSREAIASAIDRAYEERQSGTRELIVGLDREVVLGELTHSTKGEDLLETDTRAPVIKLVNLLLFEAVRLSASDVHIQPYEDRIVVRLRIDGVLFDMFDVPKRLQEEVVSRVKILAGMNIAEKRLAQDGRATVQVGARVIDLRISAVPTSQGERLVIRLLDKSARLYTLGELGMGDETFRRFRTLIGIEHGLILVTGPTGSGKSTTLYAALKEINSRERNILTLEDPIEYQLDGISQMQMSDRKGMTFASGLRNVLRQDPDIIMVGEIRDHETAVMAIQSALTGHLVFSTLHTNDAASAVTRLLDLGIEPYLVASSLVGVMAQRLVRRVCPDCAETLTSYSEPMRDLDLEAVPPGTTIRTGKGCEECRQTGYRGRVGLFELLIVDAAIRGLIQTRATAADIRSMGVERGMRTLRDDGIEKILRGCTTQGEVLRVTYRVNL